MKITLWVLKGSRLRGRFLPVEFLAVPMVQRGR